jgi:DNA mismatch repair protein MutS
MLHSWISKPLVNPAPITKRQRAVGELLEKSTLRNELSEILSNILDIERLTSRAVYGTANAKDLQALSKSILRLPEIKTLISDVESESLKGIYDKLDTLEDISSLLEAAITDDPPLTVREGGIIRDGFNADVDYYRSIKNGGVDIMRSIEEREREATGIKILKVSHNSVFGYYIEVSK